MAMSDDEFDALVTSCIEALEVKQAKLTEQFGLGKYHEWAYDQTTGVLRFKDDRGAVRIEADVTQIGSFSTRGQTWRWAWANPSVVDAQRQKSEKLCELYEATGFDAFRAEVFEASEETAWALTAVAVEHLGAVGCYRGPAQHLLVFMAIDRIRLMS